MDFAEDMYRRLEMFHDSAPDPEETEYAQERRILSVERFILAQETEEDAQKEYSMDDVLQGQTSLFTKVFPCSDDVQ